jgi:hypothetical protein
LHVSFKNFSYHILIIQVSIFQFSTDICSDFSSRSLKFILDLKIYITVRATDLHWFYQNTKLDCRFLISKVSRNAAYKIFDELKIEKKGFEIQKSQFLIFVNCFFASDSIKIRRAIKLLRGAFFWTMIY